MFIEITDIIKVEPLILLFVSSVLCVLFPSFSASIGVTEYLYDSV